MEKKNALRVSRVLAVAATVVAGAAFAAAQPDDVIKYRQNVMKATGAPRAASAAIIQGKVDFKNHLDGHVKSVQTEAHDIKNLFPEGSDFGDTKAKDAVWKNRAAFNKAADDTAAKADALAEAVAAKDTKSYPQHLKALADSCKSCHKDFRREEKQ